MGEEIGVGFPPPGENPKNPAVDSALMPARLRRPKTVFLIAVTHSEPALGTGGEEALPRESIGASGLRWQRSHRPFGAPAFDALPHFLVEVEDHGVAGGLDQRQRAAHQQAAREQPAQQEGDGEVEQGEAEGLGHGGHQMRINLIMGLVTTKSSTLFLADP